MNVMCKAYKKGHDEWGKFWHYKISDNTRFTVRKEGPSKYSVLSVGLTVEVNKVSKDIVYIMFEFCDWSFTLAPKTNWNKL